MTDAFSLNTIFIAHPHPQPSQPPPSRRDRHPDKGSDAGLGVGIEIRSLSWEKVNKSSVGEYLDSHAMTEKQHKALKNNSFNHQFLLCSVCSPDLCLWYKYDARPRPLSGRWALRAGPLPLVQTSDDYWQRLNPVPTPARPPQNFNCQKIMAYTNSPGQNVM